MTVPDNYESTKKKLSLENKQEMDTITLYSRELPERIVIDEGYDVMRRLYSEEFPAVIARILEMPPDADTPTIGNRHL